MAIITIQNLDRSTEDRLRVRAAKNGRSIEAEARSIIADTLTLESGEALNLADAIRRHIKPLGGIDLDEHPPVPIGDPPYFGR